MYMCVEHHRRKEHVRKLSARFVVPPRSVRPSVGRLVGRSPSFFFSRSRSFLWAGLLFFSFFSVLLFVSPLCMAGSLLAALAMASSLSTTIATCVISLSIISVHFSASLISVQHYQYQSRASSASARAHQHVHQLQPVCQHQQEEGKRRKPSSHPPSPAPFRPLTGHYI